MSMADSFAVSDAHYRSKVAEETWGHLAPKERRTYKGYVVFALGCFGSDWLNPTALACEFKDLDSSPWFYNSLCDFMHQYSVDENIGKVLRFDGTFRNYVFKGEVREVFSSCPLKIEKEPDEQSNRSHPR